MLSNTHIIDRFLDKDEIEIEDIFSDVCEIQQISPQTLPRVEPKVELDTGEEFLKPKRTIIKSMSVGMPTVVLNPQKSITTVMRKSF